VIARQPEAPPSPQTLPPARPGLAQVIRRHPVTFSLIALNLVVFAAQQLLISLLGFDLVIGLGAKENTAIAAGQYWRLITPVFIHAGLAHLFVNMYSLYVIGPSAEEMFGRLRFLCFFVLAGLGGAIFSLAFNASPSVGASGAIFGLLGMLGAFWYLHRTTFGSVGKLQLRQIAMVAALNLLIGLSPGIDFWAHLGGFLTGIALALLFGPRYQPRWTETGQVRMQDIRPWAQVRFGVLASLAALIALAALVVFNLP
jgi:rhomboid protease GluP